jgi:hypothetical protein
MKTEDRKVGEAGCAPVYWEVPATHKMGDAMGRRSGRSSFLEDPGAKFFCGKRGDGANPEETGQEERTDPSASGRPLRAQIQSLQDEESSVRSLNFLFFLHSRAGRSGPQRSRARRFLARRSAPLTARTTARESAREEKTCSQACKI